jgi:hypothetical protein
MNITTFNESPTAPTVPRPKWRVRHPHLNYIITMYMWILLGLAPGIFMLIMYNVSQQYHVALTAFQTSIVLAAIIITGVFGILLSLIVGLLTLIAEKLNPEL